MPGEMRDLGLSHAAATEWKPAGKSYVVAVGIGEYANLDQLPNAVKDAARIVEVLKRCDFTEPPGVSPLYNADASLDALNSLVRDRLLGALTPDDSLVIFYAGHGETVQSSVWDPEKPGQKKTIQTGYLLPVDARLTERAGWLRLDTFLDDIANLPALHILVILDACKSGFALSDKFKFRGADMGGTLTDLAQRPSRRVMTSAMHDQKAMDGGGTGNSLFTETLADAIENMEPDQDRDGFVTSRQLFDFVQSRVGDKARQVFNVKQTPDYGYLGGDGSGDLILSLQGDRFKLRQAADSLAAADAVYHLGQWTGDKKRFAFAARLYEEARDLAILGRSPSPEAELGLGKALFGAGTIDEGVKAISAVLEAGGDKAPADAGLWLGVALAKRHDYEQAAETLKTWSAAHPDHPHAPWAGSYAAWVRRAAEGSNGRRRALLVGIDKYQMRDLPKLRGCRNDVLLLMEPALRDHCGFAEADVQTLLDQDATLAGVRAGFQQLVTESAPEDVVWVHYTGHSVPPGQDGKIPDNPERVYLVVYDTTNEAGHLGNGMPAAELHAWMQRIPAERKILSLDTHANLELLKLARDEGDYALILASDSGEFAFESTVDVNGKHEPCGLLSLALATGLQGCDAETVTFDALMLNAGSRAAGAAQLEMAHTAQTPLFEGSRHRLVFGPEDQFLRGFEFAELGQRDNGNAGQLAKQYRGIERAGDEAYPPVHLAFGRALLAGRSWNRAIPPLQRAVNLEPDARDEATLTLARTYLAGRRYEDAAAALATLGPRFSGLAAKAAPLLTSLAHSRKLALIVDMGDRPSAGAAAESAKAADLVKVLIERWGFDEANVRQLVHPDATQAALQEAFETALAAAGPGSQLLFFYLGLAKWSDGLVMTISKGFMLVDELASRAFKEGVDLVLLIDGGTGPQNWQDEARELVSRGASKRFSSVAALESYFAQLRAAGISITSALPRR